MLCDMLKLVLIIFNFEIVFEKFNYLYRMMIIEMWSVYFNDIGRDAIAKIIILDINNI